MVKYSLSAALSLGLCVSQLGAQTTTSGSTSTSGQSTIGQTTTNDSTGSSAAATSNTAFRDGKLLIGASLSTSAGRYGAITDLVYDGTGGVRFALVEHQGQLHPVPFSLLQFSATGDVNIALSSAALDAVTIDGNNLQTLISEPFVSQLRAAFGPNVVRGLANPAGVVPGTGNGNANPDSTAGQRSQLYSLSSLLGGTVTGQGTEAGTISTVAIAPNGQIAYAVGTTPTGDQRFAVPFSFATVASGGRGLTTDATVQALTNVTLTGTTLPTFSNQSFANSILSAFGERSNRLFASFGSGLTTQSGIAQRDDVTDPFARSTDSSRSGADAIARAGDPARSGANAVARAGDPARSGVNAVSRPGDQTSAMRSVNTAGTAGTSTAATTGTTGTTGTSTGSSTTGGIVNMAPTVSTAANLSNASGAIQLSDLLNFRIQAQDGTFGRVADVVFDRSGQIQYLLANNQGQIVPLPFTPTAFSGAPGTLNFNVPVATLQQLAINPNDLPTLSNQAFVTRMQQVFGPSFGTGTTTTSFFGPTATGSNTTGSNTTGSNTTGSNTTGSNAAGTTTGANSTGTTSGTFNTAGTQATPQGSVGTTGLRGPGARTGTAGTSAAGSSTGTGTGNTATSNGGVRANGDTWSWPTTGTTGTGTRQAPPPGSPFRKDDPPPFPSFAPAKSRTGGGTGAATGTRTGTGSGMLQAPPPGSPFQKNYPPPFPSFAPGKSNNGNTENSGVGTGGRAVNPPPRGKAVGNGGTTGSTSGSNGTGTGTSGTSGGSGSTTSGSSGSGS